MLPLAREIKIRIDDRLCQLCDPCLAAKACNVRAIVKIDPDEAPYVDIGRCYDCRLCLPACPYEAVFLV
jgi:Fe-S-cluster-containing hydrogenase component 2